MKSFLGDKFQWGPNDGAPLTIHYSALAGVREFKRDFGISWPRTLLTHKGDKMTWFNDNDFFIETGKEVVRKFILDKKKKEKIKSLWEERIQKFVQVTWKFTDLRKMSDSELIGLYREFNKAYFGFWGIGMLAELVNFGAEALLMETIGKIPEKERETHMVTLSTPTKLSFYAKEEVDLFKIEKELLKFKKEIIKGKAKIFKQLTEHKNKYYWILNNYYETHYLGEKYFLGVVRKHFLDNVDQDEEINKILSCPKKAKIKKEKLIKKYKLEKKSVVLANIIDEFILFQDERKEYNLIAHQFIDLFLKEVGERKNIRFQSLKYLFPEEIIRFFQGKDYRRLIKKREKILVVEYDKEKYAVFDKKKSKAYYDSLFHITVSKDTKEIKGIIANKGFIEKGRVRILLSVREINKLKKGEILVTTMTTPDFIVAMKKSGAIITDQGGLTSHAAIVSRELGIPCIVGTKIATEVLKDGDLVEVDADRGVVKILKK